MDCSIGTILSSLTYDYYNGTRLILQTTNKTCCGDSGNSNDGT